jgi:hypothetical protein
MPTTVSALRLTRDGEVVLCESDIREQIKYHEGKIALLREKLILAKKVARLDRRLSENPSSEPLRRKNPAEIQPPKPSPVRPLREEIRALRGHLPSRFTSIDVLHKLRNFPFSADPKSSVRDAIYELTKKGELKIVTPGKGGKPNTLEWPQASSKVAAG